MLLDQNNFGSAFIAIPKMVEVFRAQLEAAQGVVTKLNQSVELADSVLKDAINGNPVQAMLPCIRIAWTNQTLLVPGSGGALNSNVLLHLFFLYEYGVPSMDSEPMEFSSLREQHIAWNFEYLKFLPNQSNSTIGFIPAQRQDNSGHNFWWYPPDGSGQEVSLQHETPFDIFGVTTNMNKGFSCSRLDLRVTVKNHCIFNP